MVVKPSGMKNSHFFLDQWRNLEKEEKEKYEEKAKRVAEEQQAKQEAAEKAFNESLNRSQSPWNEQHPAQGGTAARPSTPGNQSKWCNSKCWVIFRAFVVVC